MCLLCLVSLAFCSNGFKSLFFSITLILKEGKRGKKTDVFLSLNSAPMDHKVHRIELKRVPPASL